MFALETACQLPAVFCKLCTHQFSIVSRRLLPVGRTISVCLHSHLMSVWRVHLSLQLAWLSCMRAWVAFLAHDWGSPEQSPHAGGGVVPAEVLGSTNEPQMRPVL